MKQENFEAPDEGLKKKIHSIIFEADTPAGRAFDLVLIGLIVSSVAVVILESVLNLSQQHGQFFYIAEWTFTILFLVEYLLRLYSVKKPWTYAKSFFGIIDLAACLPTLLSFFIPGTQSLIVIRALRLIRVFRILKLGWYFNEGMLIVEALKAAKAKITVFLFFILLIVVIAGTAMYLIEGPEAGFVSIPVSMYWAVVTLTTVGYGDIAPVTFLGRLLASLLMITGYAIIAVPTGIVTSELTRRQLSVSNKACSGCGAQGHYPDAVYCRYCGVEL